MAISSRECTLLAPDPRALRLGAGGNVGRRIRESLRKLSKGRAGGLLLPQPVKRHGELQVAVGRLLALDG